MVLSTEVYSNSTEPFKGGVKIVKVLAESDFKKAENELIADLNTNALKKFIKAGIPLSPSQLLVSDVEYSTDDAIGQQKLTFLMNATGTAHAVLFDIQNLEEKAKQALYDSLPKNQSILAYNSDSFVFSVLSIDASKNQADLSTSIEGFAVLQDSTGIISPMNLAGLTAQEIQSELLKNKAVQEVRVEFSPFWVTRAPRIAEKITIEVISSE